MEPRIISAFMVRRLDQKDYSLTDIKFLEEFPYRYFSLCPEMFGELLSCPPAETMMMLHICLEKKGVYKDCDEDILQNEGKTGKNLNLKAG